MLCPILALEVAPDEPWSQREQVHVTDTHCGACADVIDTSHEFECKGQPVLWSTGKRKNMIFVSHREMPQAKVLLGKGGIDLLEIQT